MSASSGSLTAVVREDLEYGLEDLVIFEPLLVAVHNAHCDEFCRTERWFVGARFPVLRNDALQISPEGGPLFIEIRHVDLYDWQQTRIFVS